MSFLVTQVGGSLGLWLGMGLLQLCHNFGSLILPLTQGWRMGGRGKGRDTYWYVAALSEQNSFSLNGFTGKKKMLQKKVIKKCPIRGGCVKTVPPLLCTLFLHGFILSLHGYMVGLSESHKKTGGETFWYNKKLFAKKNVWLHWDYIFWMQNKIYLNLHFCYLDLKKGDKKTYFLKLIKKGLNNITRNAMLIHFVKPGWMSSLHG